MPWVRYQLKVHQEGCKIGLSGCIMCLYQFASQWGNSPTEIDTKSGGIIERCKKARSNRKKARKTSPLMSGHIPALFVSGGQNEAADKQRI